MAAYYERRLFDDAAALALQAKYAVGPDLTRTIAGAVGKYYLTAVNALFLAEADLVHFTVGGGTYYNQFVGVAGASVRPARGVLITVLAERNQQNLRVSDSTWNAATGLFGWFPYPHTEVQLMTQLQFPAGGGGGGHVTAGRFSRQRRILLSVTRISRPG